MKVCSVSIWATWAAASRKAMPCMSMRWVTTAKALASERFYLGREMIVQPFEAGFIIR